MDGIIVADASSVKENALPASRENEPTSQIAHRRCARISVEPCQRHDILITPHQRNEMERSVGLRRAESTQQKPDTNQNIIIMSYTQSFYHIVFRTYRSEPTIP